ncbi:glycosyltransferase family 87 protein [Haloferax chudinovii]|uniref:Glycosyltransferase family 87 protein n=1 Tax=Haloferax chudinovii TaxID=1109010 RepID=A0ABD5XIM4_9EURY
MIFISGFRIGTDFRVYYYAAKAAVSGENFYTVSPPAHPGYYFLYPPIVILFFLPYGLFSSWVLPFLIHTGISIAASIALSWAIVVYLRNQGIKMTQRDFALVTAFVLLSAHSVPNLLHGQINTLLAVCIGTALLAHERDLEGWSGRILSLAALVKVWPAAIGLWYVCDRSWTAIVNAVTVGVGGLIGGYLLFGQESTVEFFSILTNRYQTDVFAGGLAPEAVYLTIRRPLSHLLPTDNSLVLSVTAFLVLAPFVALTYQRIQTPIERMIAIFVTVAAVLLFFTSFLIYFPVLFAPLLVLLYSLEESQGRTVFLAGAFIANFPFSFRHINGILSQSPLPDQLTQVLLEGTGFVLTYGTPTLYGILVMILGCVLYLYQEESTSPVMSNIRLGR